MMRLMYQYPAYKLDDIKEINHPELWIKANPNLGITVDYSVYQQDVERAEKAPASRNDIVAKKIWNTRCRLHLFLCI